MVAGEAIYWGLKDETVVKLDRLTQDDILRHYRADYLEVPDVSDPRLYKHKEDVLGLLYKLLLDLKMPNSPEDFVSLHQSQEDVPTPEIKKTTFKGFPTYDRSENAGLLTDCKKDAIISVYEQSYY